MELREKGKEEMRQRSPQKPANDKEEQHQGPNGETEHLDNITASIQRKRHMEVIKSELLERAHSQLSDLLDKVLEEAAHSFTQPSRKDSAKMQSRAKSPVQKKQKVFTERQALLDELMEVKDLRSIYHIFVAMFGVFAVRSIVVDFMDEGRLLLDIDLFFFSLRNLHLALFVWFCMFLYTLFVPYTFLQMWARSLRTVKCTTLFTTSTAVFLHICHAAALGFYPTYAVKFYHFGPASCLIVILEQFRLLMKSHSFLRESVPAILYARSKDGKVQPPEFSTYLYFLFCPTMIYRESYPRTPYVRWTFVIKNFAQFLGCVFLLNLIVGHLSIPVFTSMRKQPFSLKTLVLAIFSSIVPGMCALLLPFYAVLHCWLNAFAEMLRFADRTFYKDWWNATSFAAYYRTWNVVVHDWLYFYIYQDLVWLLQGKGQVAALLFTFLLSAVAHEYAITMSLGFFYPVMFTLFAIFGVIFNFIMHDKRTNPAWNVLMWAILCVGKGIVICLYSQEWYAHIDCPLQQPTFWDLVTPRSWSCHT